MTLDNLRNPPEISGAIRGRNRFRSRSGGIQGYPGATGGFRPAQEMFSGAIVGIHDPGKPPEISGAICYQSL